MKKILSFCISLVLLGYGCEQNEPIGCQNAADYFPLKEGNYWKYKLIQRIDGPIMTFIPKDTLIIMVKGPQVFDRTGIIYYLIYSNVSGFPHYIRIEANSIYGNFCGIPGIMYKFCPKYEGEYYSGCDWMDPIKITSLGYNAIFKRQNTGLEIEEVFTKGIGITEISINNNELKYFYKYLLIEYKI
jgi:hypothetical protein